MTPDPSPTATPIFESDEAALAAAEEAYRAYLAVSDQIFIDGGRNADRIDAVASKEHAKLQKDAFAKMLREGRRGTGETSFDSMTLKQFDGESEAGNKAVSVYVCLDISRTDSLDRDGNSIVASNRKDKLPVEIYFDTSSMAPSKLMVDSLEIWSGADFCV
ncbi:MAG: hypothetical protein ACOH1T_03510 [Microbacteriaceae bacterium]